MEHRPSAIVHLVHGTWPFGVFGKRLWQPKLKAWFEPGSSVRNGIESDLEISIEWREFSWSGTNSFFARRQAAIAFREHLRCARADYPGTPQLIVAHSHGGTVALRTLCDVANSSKRQYSQECNVEALICLATPFAYLSTNRRGAAATASCFGLFFVSIVWMAIALCLPNAEEAHAGAVTVALVLSSAMVVGTMRAFSDQVPPPHYCAGDSVAGLATVFILRASRDEAALLIGFAQALHAVAGALTNFYHNVSRFSSLSAFVVNALLVLAVAIIGNIVIYIVWGTSLYDASLQLAFWQSFIVGLMLWFQICTFPLVTSLALLAYVTGFGDFRYWFCSMIEVDAVPPGMPVHFKAYGSSYEPANQTLRHGIYNMAEVQRDIARLINMVGTGETPQFLPPSKLDMVDFIT